MIKMDFGNTNPCLHIYREFINKVYDQYLYHTGKKEYQTLHALFYKPEKSYESSIDDILAQDSRKVFDKLKNTALSIADRIKIHNDINYVLEYNCYAVKRDLMSMYQFYPVRDRGSERRRSFLRSDLFRIYKTMFDEKLSLWEHLKDLKTEFIDLFHEYKSMKQDKKILE